ncbi:hypothetical protein C8A03DRAFT_16966, partial [Achaetomium macrosporum]
LGDLGPEFNEYVLVSQSCFPSCKSAKTMADAMTGQSHGYSFVRFSDESDQLRALVKMQGVYCGNRPMRISTATPKTRSHGYGQSHGTNPRRLPTAWAGRLPILTVHPDLAALTAAHPSAATLLRAFLPAPWPSHVSASG